MLDYSDWKIYYGKVWTYLGDTIVVTGAAGEAHVAFSLNIPGITFTGITPGISFAKNKPDITFTT